MSSFDPIRALVSEMSPIEGVAALLIAVNVWLVARRSIWNYAFGIVGVAIYGWVFFHRQLYSDTLLQAFFFVVQFYGLQQWRRSEVRSGEVVVERMSDRARIAWGLGIVVSATVWGWLMYRLFNASMPWLDAFSAMTSVAAQILMSKRKLENWWLWIAANALQIWLYAAKALWITMGLYVVLLGIAIWGLARWQAARHEPRP